MPKKVFSLDNCCSLRGLGCYESLWETYVQIASTNYPNRGLGRLRLHFFRFYEVLKRYTFFDIFFGHKKVGNKSQISVTWITNSILAAIFGRGRRKRRGAREEKQEGSLRTVDCAFKS